MSICVKSSRLFLLVLLAVVCSSPSAAQVPTPESVIGWQPGTDYKLTNSGQIVEYFEALDAASDRIDVVEIGRSVEGRPIIMAIISSAENISNKERYREISRRLALATGVTDEEARRLSREGKAVVWIDHGLHATEVAHAEAGMVLAHHLVTSEDHEVQRMREHAIILLPPMLNPDGHERVLAWYSRNLGTEFEMASLPFIDHPYVGHENNRDAFQISTPEIEAATRVMWHEWIPQIVVNHHQGGPFPSRIFIPPHQEPLNPNIHPLVSTGMNVVGSHMGTRFASEQKPGAVSRISYTLWWNGGVRGAAYFHNQIGILTEINTGRARWASPAYEDPASLPANFGSSARPVGMTADAPSLFYPYPWKGGWWRLKDQVDYVVTASMGAADIGARLSDDWLYNIYQMGRDEIRAGRAGGPYAYIVPLADQWDRGAAVELVNLLQRGAVEVHRATEAFSAGGRSYPNGTVIAFAAQAFRPHLVDLMEAQEHPDLRSHDGGPPIPPYDQAAWTVPMGMGVQVVRVDEPFEASVEPVRQPVTLQGSVEGRGPVFLLTAAHNASFEAVNQLWAAGLDVSRAITPVEAAGRSWPAGTFVVRADADRLSSIARSSAAEFVAIGRVEVDAMTVRKPRVGLYRSYVVNDHNPDEGWTRWIFDRYGFDYETLEDPDVRKGDLSRFDAIILPDPGRGVNDILQGHAPGTMPPEFSGGLGAEGAANLKRFVERGGRVIALDRASNFAIAQFGLPIRNAVSNVPTSELFIPGSFLKAEIDSEHPLAYGMQSEAAVMYYRRRGAAHMAFDIIEPASTGDRPANSTVEVAARFAGDDLLLSGWELGADRHLGRTPALVQIPVGEGDVVLMNFRPQFRDQVRGTFKFLFNAMVGAAMEKPRPTTD
jgi:hypothetical protein